MGEYSKIILVLVFMAAWAALCVWAALRIVAWTLIRSTFTGGLTRSAETQAQDKVKRDFITPEFYAAQGLADVPRGNLILEDDEDIHSRLRREGL